MSLSHDCLLPSSRCRLLSVNRCRVLHVLRRGGTRHRVYLHSSLPTSDMHHATWLAGVLSWLEVHRLLLLVNLSRGR